jgi:hypothetical protein
MMQQSVQSVSSPGHSQSDFVSTLSKGRLWKILQDNGAFNGINNNFFTKVREDFEIGRIEEEHRDKPVMIKSKLFIDMMIQKMNEYKHVQLPDRVQQPYTAQDIKKSKLDAFDNELSRKQNEFNQFNARPTPPHMDFADKDEDASGNVNRLLEQAMRDRENLEVPGPINAPPRVKEPEPVSNINLESLESKVNKNEETLNKIMEKLASIEELLKKENNNEK